jgi:predicted Zn-dependent protease
VFHFRKKLDIGKIERSYVDKYLTKVVERIEAQLQQQQFQSLLSELNLSKKVLEACDSKKEFIHAFFKKIGLPQEEIEQFHSMVKKLENEGQYDSERLLTELKKVFKPTKKPTIKGYLGITEADIFTKDYNFLYGWARQSYRVMSYHRFKSDFTEEPPNRPWVCNRTVKQGI